MSPPLVDHGRWQCSGCRWVFKMPWQQQCPACNRRDYWTGSVAPDGAVWPSCELLVDYDGRCYDDDCPVHGLPPESTP